MYDAPKVLAGLAVFVLVFTSPFWYNLAAGQRAKSPELIIPAAAGQKCILMPRQRMISGHMSLLNQWRNSVVREGNRVYRAEDGTEYQMSLSNTCLKCHTNKAEFCDRCHAYSAVAPFCWDCHADPRETR